MPVVGRGDEDDIDVLAVEELRKSRYSVGFLPPASSASFARVSSTSWSTSASATHSTPSVFRAERMSAQPMPLQPMTPKRTTVARRDFLVSAAASRPGVRPTAIAARDEPLMKCLREPFMSIHLAS